MNQLPERLTIAPESLEFRIVLTIATVVLVLSIIFFVHGEVTQGSDAAGDSFTLSGGGPFDTKVRVWVICCLGLVVGGLAVRKPIGVFTSLSCVIGLLFLYVWWYRKSLALLRNNEVLDYSAFDRDFPHVGGIWGATWWDITVLAIAVILLIWHLTVLLRTANATVIGSRS